MALVNVSIEEFLNQSCCKKNCISSFDLADIERIRDSFLDLTSEEKDTVLLGFFMQWFKPGDHLSSDVDYRMEGKKICRKSFLFLTNISKTKLQNLRSHYHKRGTPVKAAWKHWTGTTKQPFVWDEWDGDELHWKLRWQPWCNPSWKNPSI